MTTADNNKEQNAVIVTLEQATKYLDSNKQPIFYVSRSATNLLGVQRSVPSLYFVTFVDSWKNRPEWAFSPTKKPYLEPRGNINTANWLLRNQEVQNFISDKTPQGLIPQIVVAMFDEVTEDICKNLGYELAMPPTKLRTNVDSKITTTQMGNSAGIASAPNILTTISSWDDLVVQSQSAGLGSRLVIQTAFGDSGHTTFFVNCESDYDKISRRVNGHEIKVMKNIQHLPLAAEAVVLKNGTIMGPLILEVTGQEELTQYKGGWAGSDLIPQLLSQEEEKLAEEIVHKFSEKLRDKGYRGTLEVSILLDTDSRELYLGELNPRISGSAPISNLAPKQALPLFAFHLIEYLGEGLSLDFSQVMLNQKKAFANERWSTMIIPSRFKNPVRLTQVPETGRYKIDENSIHKIQDELDWHDLTALDEFFFFRTVNQGEIASRGTSLGVLVTRFSVQDEDLRLTAKAKTLIQLIQAMEQGKKLSWVETLFRKVLFRVGR